MSSVVVLGAGVVGSAYAGLLARAGHAVVMVARGTRYEQLRSQGLRVVLDGERVSAPVEVVARLADATADLLVVCVRGDQFKAVLDEVADCPAGTVMVFTNPLGLRDEAEQRIGRDRLVWCFSGLGGAMSEGMVTAHRVAQQPTVVETGQPASTEAEHLLAGVDDRLRRESDMGAWLDTHTVFVAAMAAVILDHSLGTRWERWSAAAVLVSALREAFTVLEERGGHVTPGNLRTIFGRVPIGFAVAYWAWHLSRPMVTVAMAPHARTTRDTEQRAVARHALRLVGDHASHYRELVVPIA